jgi:hypothetical protein
MRLTHPDQPGRYIDVRPKAAPHWIAAGWVEPESPVMEPVKRRRRKLKEDQDGGDTSTTD